MVTVKFFTTLRLLTGIREITISNVKTVRQLLDKLVEKYGNKFYQALFEKPGVVKSTYRVMVNGRSITMLKGIETSLNPTDEIALFPPIGGGSQTPYHGYAGKILRVNLTNEDIKKEQLPNTLIQLYIGGTGLAAHYLFNEVPPGTDPLSSKNKLIFVTGPITGSIWPTSGRMAIVSKAPLTGIWGESHVGGSLGPEIKFAGYDFIVIEGQSENPVTLHIKDDDITILPSREYWGKNTHETNKLLKDKLGPGTKIACIGQAGEKQVRYACIMVHKNRAAGRTGLGAVMGSKKLKAVAVEGSGSVKVAQPEEYNKLSLKAHKRILTNEQAHEMYLYGTPILVSVKQNIGEFPTRNHQEGVFEGAELLSAEVLREKYWEGTHSCFACSNMCKKTFSIPQGKYAGTFSGGPEYEGIMAFGSNCGNSDFGSILKANLLCNQYGLDVISAGGVIATMMELYEKGLLTKEKADGLSLDWGNDDTIIELVHKISNREGIGDLAAEGAKSFAEKISQGAEQYALHVKGMELSGQDGRTHRSIALTHATSARGADHLRSLVTVDQLGYKKVAAARFGKDKLPEICDPYVETHKAPAVIHTENVYNIRDSLLVCWYTCAWPPIFWIEDFAEILPLATGVKRFGSVRELMRIAERQQNLKRAFNVREGITRKQDTLPSRFTKEPMPGGPGKGQVVNLEPMLDEYYKLRNWDPKTGIPRKTQLVKLGLENIAAKLEKIMKLPE